MSQVAYRFGAVEVRPAERQILVEGKPAAVGARAFDLLLALIDQRDRVIGKNELLDRVWPGLVVEENNLQVQVSTLRKLLGSQSIATLPGRGYRFTIPLDSDVPGPTCPFPGSPHNLPAQLNTFVGREPQIARLKEALVNARLVTLTGTGGTGKSRLSLHVAAQVTADYADGVWLVELSPVTDASRVPRVVAFALGVKEEPGRPLVDTLAVFLKPKRTLLILDNCEHLLGACAELARHLLLSAPLLKIMASSREPLHVTGEARFPVPALDIETEATRLFVDRAAAVNPAFRLTPENQPTVGQICRRLDGIPLAIELAAARVAALPVDRIAVLLDDAFRVLTQGDRTAPTRQQTLRASIDWSYELLSAGERTLLRRLAVFSGGWTLEAAEAVLAEGDIAGDDVVELLTQLVEKSLVDIDERGERYRLLETVRQYALELASAAGEIEALRSRHVAYFLQMAQHARRESGGPRQPLWFARLDADLENLLSALSSCDQLPDGPVLGTALSRSLRHYWIRGGHLALGLQTTAEALARLPANDRSLQRLQALFDMGQLHSFAAQYGQAQRYLEECIAIARELGLRREVGFGLQPLALALMGLGRIAEARACYEEGVEIAREGGDANEVAAALNGLGQIERVQGDLAAAERLLQEALTLASRAGHHYTMLITMLNLAIVWIEGGEKERARSVLREILAQIEGGGAASLAQSALEVTAAFASFLGDWDAAARFYGAAEATADKTGLRRGAADDAFLIKRVDEARRRLDPAAFESREKEGRALAAGMAVEQARAWLEKA